MRTRCLPLWMVVAALTLLPIGQGASLGLAEAVAAAAPATVLGVDRVQEVPGLSPAADLLAVELRTDPADGTPLLRVSFLCLDLRSLAGIASAAARAAAGPVTLSVSEAGSDAPARPLAEIVLGDPAKAAGLTRPGDPDAVYLRLPADWARPSADGPRRLLLATAHVVADGPAAPGDVLEVSYPPDKTYTANCAFVLHGNQGVGYTDVLHGRGDDLDGSGFDEALQVHQATAIPGNFHLSGTLQTSAEWAARNGDPVDFNAWLAAGVSAGWAGMVTSAYGQHIMPFVADAMNDWAVEIQAQMTDARYGYVPTVAWVPERVWLNTSGYPSSGVNDWIGDDWTAHGVGAVILDDDVHLSGYDNHQIHTLSGGSLRLIPRDRTFTGNIVGGNGQASLDILTALAGGGLGQYRIAVFAEDWEAVAEMGSWASVTPNAKETYDWFIGKCSTESSWLHTWKLADAVANPDFAGSTFSPAPGTYNEIGGTGGYGGGDNGWYTHWAGWVPYANGGDGNGTCAGAGGNCKNYGTLWNDAYDALMAAPDNNLSQAGWYVLMTNLHETGWHDYMGGPISGWQHKYSAHIKNAMIYAEAAHWAAGEYAATTAAYTADIDDDGYLEAVLHNDRLFGVLEGNGGRLTHLFVKGPGYDDTAIGVDNAYWSDTDADYNDANHVGAFSEVSPNYQHDGYGWSIGPVDPVGPTVSLTLVRNEVTKEILLREGDPYFDVVYRVGPATHWIQSGFSPSLVDLVWNGELQRVWPADAAYMGQRNPNTGIAAAWILGTAGASHQRDFSGTLMKGDEILGSGVFQVRLYAGLTGAPDGSGDIAELRAAANGLTDTIGPAVTAAAYYPATDRLQVTFDQAVAACAADGFTVADGPGPVSSLTLPAATPVDETDPGFTRTFALDPATAAAIEAMAGPLYLVAAAGAVQDENAVGNEAVVLGDLMPIDVAATAVAVDGNLQAAEWQVALVLPDSSDSQWTAANEIDRLLARWDLDYLYLAIDGQVTANSWLLYLDVNPGQAGGQTDLTAIDAWERGALFTAPGFAPDFQYGCYQHQSAWDGDGFWQLVSATSAQDRSGEIVSAFDSYHVYGESSGSEIAVPWNTLYGLGAGAVPAGAQIAVAAAICWDPEPSGVLGGDSAPSNLAAALPTIDAAWTLTIDVDGDGRPDMPGVSPVPRSPAPALRLLPNVPNPFNPSTDVRFFVPGTEPVPVDLGVFDLRGRRVATLLSGPALPGENRVVWDGRDRAGLPAAAGTYFCRLQSRGLVLTRSLSLVK